MIYTPQTEKAMKLMFQLHKDQIDKGGIPYVFHPWHVAESMSDEVRTIVALLHDVIEDTNITISDLKEMGFERSVLEALTCITHLPGEEYYDYVKRIGENPIAIDVKISDLRHNMDKSRLKKISKKYTEKYIKYQNSIEYLTHRKKILSDNCDNNKKS